MKRRAFLALAGGLAVAPTAVLAAHKKSSPAKGSTAAKAGTAAKKQPAATKGSAKASARSASKANLRAPAVSSNSHAPSGIIRTAPLPRPKFENWRRYELQIRLTPGDGSAPLRTWIPVPMESDWQRLDDMEWQGNFSHAALKRDPESGLLSFVTDWQGARNGAPEASLTLRMSTRQRLFDITRRGLSLESEDSLTHSLQPFGPWPQDAIADLAERIIGRIREPMPQAMAIYDWLVDHAGPNCAPGSAPEAINNTLCRSFDKTDKGEDAGLTGLFVALCRATGIPARFVSGQRLGPSRQSPSLGVAGNAASAQHCRAEFHAANYGWVPVDPADAARALLMDRGSLDSGTAQALKKRLFGFWEMNWVAYYNGDAVRLPQGPEQPLPWVTRPQAASVERDGGLRLQPRPVFTMETRPLEG